jgi:hypothetical protein
LPSDVATDGGSGPLVFLTATPVPRTNCTKFIISTGRRISISHMLHSRRETSKRPGAGCRSAPISDPVGASIARSVRLGYGKYKTARIAAEWAVKMAAAEASLTAANVNINADLAALRADPAAARDALAAAEDRATRAEAEVARLRAAANPPSEQQ